MWFSAIWHKTTHWALSISMPLIRFKWFNSLYLTALAIIPGANRRTLKLCDLRWGYKQMCLRPHSSFSPLDKRAPSTPQPTTDDGSSSVFYLLSDSHLSSSSPNRIVTDSVCTVLLVIAGVIILFFLCVLCTTRNHKSGNHIKSYKQ